MNTTKKIATFAVALSALGAGVLGVTVALPSSGSARPTTLGASVSNSVAATIAAQHTTTTSRVAPALGGEGTSGVIEVREVHRPGESVAGTDSGQWASMADLMIFIVKDASNVWSWYYEQWGYGPSSVNYNFPAAGETITACGGEKVSDDTSPFYCPSDDTIYFSQGRALWYWQKSGGDFGVATSMAHEYAHNVQSELGIEHAKYGSSRFERHADCFAGAFAHVAYYQNILDANDITEGAASRFIVGDDGVSGSDPHGTPEQRAAAFMLGYNSAGPAGCDSILK